MVVACRVPDPTPIITVVSGKSRRAWPAAKFGMSWQNRADGENDGKLWNFWVPPFLDTQIPG